jgi:hypothetical protein
MFNRPCFGWRNFLRLHETRWTRDWLDDSVLSQPRQQLCCYATSPFCLLDSRTQPSAYHSPGNHKQSAVNTVTVEDGCFLGCCTMQSGRSSQTFKRCLLPPSLGRWLSTSETSVKFYQTTWCNNPEDSNLHTRRRENLKSHTVSYSLFVSFCLCKRNFLSTYFLLTQVLFRISYPLF